MNDDIKCKQAAFLELSLHLDNDPDGMLRIEANRMVKIIEEVERINKYLKDKKLFHILEGFRHSLCGIFCE